MTKSISTFNRLMKDKKRRQRFEREYKVFLLSELLLDLMAGENISVRELARSVGLSPTVIQEVRSGKRKNITLKSFIKILENLGAEVVIRKDGRVFPLGLVA